MSRGVFFPKLDPASIVKPIVWQPFDVLPPRGLRLVWVKGAGDTSYARRPMTVSSLYAYMERVGRASHMFWTEMTPEEMRREEREGNAL